MIEWFVEYGQWFVLVVSVLAIALLASSENQLRLKGYIFTAIARFSGGIIFIITELYALAIANAIYVILSIKGYFNNKDDQRKRNIMWEYWCKAIGSKAYDDDKKADRVAVIRTFWVLLNIVTCIMIILSNAKNLGWW